MFKRYSWHVSLSPDEVRDRLAENLLGEDALRACARDGLENQFTEWRLAGRPMGRVKKNRFRMFLPREALRNPMAPVLRGKIFLAESGARITARVGLSWKSKFILVVLFIVWVCVAVPWALTQAKSQGGSFVSFFLLALTFPEVFVVAIIFGIFRWAARSDMPACLAFIDTQFRDHLIPDKSESTG